MTNKIKKEMIEDESKEKKPIKKVIYDKETKGYLTPFNVNADMTHSYITLHFNLKNHMELKPKKFLETLIFII